MTKIIITKREAEKIASLVMDDTKTQNDVIEIEVNILGGENES